MNIIRHAEPLTPETERFLDKMPEIPAGGILSSEHILDNVRTVGSSYARCRVRSILVAALRREPTPRELNRALRAWGE